MMMLTRPLSFALAAIAALALPLHGTALACTSFILQSQDGGIVYARTLEFALPLHSRIIVVPRNLALTGTGPDGQAGSGMSWHSKYGVVGMDGIGLPIVVDGMNEAGLAGGALYLPGYAEYQAVPTGQERNSVASYELLLYILTNCDGGGGEGSGAEDLGESVIAGCVQDASAVACHAA